MSVEDIARQIRERVTKNAVVKTVTTGSSPWIEIAADHVVETLRFCRFDASVDADFLEDLSAIDEGSSLTVFWRLRSMSKKSVFILKASIDLENLAVPTSASLWACAELFERECSEMFGIQFAGNPDPVRFLLPEAISGHPLRKNFEFPKEVSGIHHGRGAEE